MTKYSFLIYHRDYIEFLEKLRKVGVVHVQQKSEGLLEDGKIAEHLKQKQGYLDVIKYLKSRKVAELATETKTNPDEIVKQTKSLQAELELKKAELLSLSKEMEQLKPWGIFSWDTILKLKEAGSYIHFFSCNASKYDASWKEKFQLFEMDDSRNIIHFIVITNTAEKPAIAADVLTLPSVSLDDLQASKEELKQDIITINETLDKLAATCLSGLNREVEHTNFEIDFRTVELQANNQAEDKVKLLEGWVPEEMEEEMAQQMQHEGVFYMKSKPKANENVPVLLKNNAFTKLFELVGSLYSLPSYREIDLTPFFAPFFMLFFGFCLGDAGYGLITMVAMLILRAKAKPDMKPVWTLGFLFGVSTVIMGLLGGTIFGVMLIDLKFNWLQSFQSIILDQNQLMYFSVALGLIQIVFGMCLKAARAIKIDGIKYALSTIGWIIIIIGVGGSFGLSKQNIITAELGKYMMIGFGAIGGVLALFFNSPGKNIFLNFGLGLWDAYGTVTGLLGDVLSYIRLFALGLSSAVLGSVFNQLAFDLTGDIPVLSVVFTILILLVGHSINFFMAALGSFVHPLRLTFVEFYKNTGFEGGGKKYTPFKEA